MNNDDKRSILFVGGGQETIPGVEIAKAMGLCVIVSDMSAEAPCVKLADHFLLADTYSVSDTLREVEDGGLDQHEASVKVGKILKKLFIDSALKREKKMEKKFKKEEKKFVKPKINISWSDYKKTL